MVRQHKVPIRAWFRAVPLSLILAFTFPCLTQAASQVPPTNAGAAAGAGANGSGLTEQVLRDAAEKARNQGDEEAARALEHFADLAKAQGGAFQDAGGHAQRVLDSLRQADSPAGGSEGLNGDNGAYSTGEMPANPGTDNPMRTATPEGLNADNGAYSTGEIPANPGTDNPMRTAVPESQVNNQVLDTGPPTQYSENGYPVEVGPHIDAQGTPNAANPSIYGANPDGSTGTLHVTPDSAGVNRVGEVSPHTATGGPAGSGAYRFQGYQNPSGSAQTNTAIYRDGNGNQISMAVARDPSVGYRLTSNQIPAPARAPAAASPSGITARPPTTSTPPYRPPAAVIPRPSTITTTRPRYPSSMPVMSGFSGSMPNALPRPRVPPRGITGQTQGCVPGVGCLTLVY